MKKRTVLPIILFGLFASQVHADISSGNYVGIEYMNQSASFSFQQATSTSDVDTDLDGIIFRVGRYFSNYLGLELHGGFSLEHKNFDNSTTAKNDYLAGLFVRGNIPFYQQNINLYALVGGSTARVSYTEPTRNVGGQAAGGKTTIKGNGLSYGLGLELYGTPNTALNIEWKRYLSKADFKLQGFSVGIIHHFGSSKMF